MKYGKYIFYFAVFYNVIFLLYLHHTISIREKIIIQRISNIEYNVPKFHKKVYPYQVSVKETVLLPKTISVEENNFNKKRIKNKEESQRESKNILDDETKLILTKKKKDSLEKVLNTPIQEKPPIVISPGSGSKAKNIHIFSNVKEFYLSASSKKYYIVLDVSKYSQQTYQLSFINDTSYDIKFAKQNDISINPNLKLEFPYGEVAHPGNVISFTIKLRNVNSDMYDQRRYKIIIPTIVNGDNFNDLILNVELNPVN